MENLKEWNLVKNWKFWLLAVAVVALNLLTQYLVFNLPNFDGQNRLLAAGFFLVAIGIGLWLTGRLGLWKSEQAWGWLNNVGFFVISFMVLFGVKMIGGQLIMMEEGFGKTPANQELINNSGLPAILLFLFVVFFAPILEELFFRGILMGKIFGRESIVGLVLSSVLFGLIHRPSNIGSWVIYGGMGLVLGLAYRISGKYSQNLLLHIGNNLLGIGLLLLLQYLGLM